MPSSLAAPAASTASTSAEGVVVVDSGMRHFRFLAALGGPFRQGALNGRRIKPDGSPDL